MAVQVGSRIEYRLLMAGPPEQVKAFKQVFRQQTHPEAMLDQPDEQQMEQGEQASLKLRDASQSNTRLMKTD